MAVNKSKFFQHLRGTNVLGPVITESEVKGTEAILDAVAGWPVSWQAYALATAFHETAGTMLPIRERGSGDGPDADKWDDYLEKYDTGRLAAALGNTPQADGDGVFYAGRGYVQLTGAANYKKAGAKLGLPLASQPDLALNPKVAADIMKLGMEEGWFTGLSLKQKLPRAIETRPNFIQARRIINVLDKAEKIADHALVFQLALTR